MVSLTAFFLNFSKTYFTDMCHLKPHSEKPKQANLNEVTKQFSGIVKAVDNFHFKKGHKGKWCQTNANPNIEMKKVGMVHSNTPVCEQTFSWLNKFKNIKTMNEAHFKLFLLYILDLHNLHITKKVDLVANPLNPRRRSHLSDINEDLALEDFAKLSIGVVEKDISKASSVAASTNDDNVLELDSCFSELPGGDLSCNFCSGTFKRLGHIRNHLNSKHNLKLDLKCVCGKEFNDSTKLSRHQKTCTK